MEYLTINTTRRTEFVNITEQVADAARKLGVANGAVVVFVPHTTAGITINENADPDVVADMEGALEKMVPWQAAYRHGEGNAAAHVKASLMGSSAHILIESDCLKLGTWQGIFSASSMVPAGVASGWRRCSFARKRQAP